MKGKSLLFTIGLVTPRYSSNIGVLLLNKYLLGNYGFKYPIFLTMCHMTACSSLSYIAIAWMKMVPMQTIRSRIQFLNITALSLVFCVSVVFGNISLREAWLTYLTLVPVVTGVIIASGIYTAAGEIYGAERRMASLAKAYPKLVRKEILLELSDLRFFQNDLSQMAALDYLVSLEGDIFVPTYDGNMAKVVEGHRSLSIPKQLES
ncbi:PREDICTED: probable sugar phosphate/phosphate [Prunus dulcis]|uniref:O-fucosyltransferase family protein n=1 Tax=Prunus dulcis TaxID=3755 RepID=A0A5E4ELQ3_PRUDU|nr:hypothetical protein L3X38_000318 [Prunus dulcis]VVA16597.1 PREDICTED: probable sugar phosphate/phosphate [Prunus dulcis]